MGKKKYSELDKKYVCDNYYTKTSTELAKELGASRSWVLKQWMDAGLKGKDVGRQYYCDFNYFKSIDSGNKAWLLGFIASDGNVWKRNDKHQGQIQITLNSKDEDILQDILIDMKSNNPIHHLPNKPVSSITIVNEQIFKDLNKLGIVPNKTWILDIQRLILQIPLNFVSDFFRGYFDGDGSITGNEEHMPSRYRVNIIAPLDNSKLMSKILYDYYNISSCIIEDKRDKYSHPMGSISFKNITEKYNFLKMIYNNIENNTSTLFLKRKYNKSKVLMDKIENNISNRSENKKALYFYQDHKDFY